jgi:hypothetical protein
MDRYTRGPLAREPVAAWGAAAAPP